MSKAGELIHVLQDLEIPFEDLQTNPQNMVKKMVSKAREISAELDKNTTMQELETQFRIQANKNKEARDKAEEIRSQILDLIIDEDPEVIANLIPMLSEVVQQATSQVRTMSMRVSAEKVLSKKHLHRMYIKLKAGYEAYVDFCKMFNPEAGPFPTVPSKSGNYGERAGNSGVKIYSIVMDGKEWDNPFSWARHCGLEITHYMDVVDIIKENKGIIKGHKVTLKEV